MFRETSGGICNPAVALAKIFWSHLSLTLEWQKHGVSLWSNEVAICYLVGPLAGAMAAGVSFNHMRSKREEMKNFSLKREGRLRGDEENADDDEGTAPAQCDESSTDQGCCCFSGSSNPGNYHKETPFTHYSMGCYQRNGSSKGSAAVYSSGGASRPQQLSRKCRDAPVTNQSC